MKKIFNLLASVSLVATGVSNVAACGSHQQSSKIISPKIIPQDQTLVNDIIKKLEGKSFSVNEDKKGDHNFASYKNQVLQEVKQDLSLDEKNLVSFPDFDNQKQINAEAETKIDLHIQAHSIQNDINIPVTLNSDAQSIADKLDGDTFTVLQTGGYQNWQPAKDYSAEIKNDLLTPAEQAEGYKVSGWEQSQIGWPYWDNKTGHEVDPNKLINIPVAIGKDVATAKIKFEFKDYLAKQKLDDPNEGSKTIPFEISTGGQTIPGTTKAWRKAIIKNKLDTAWVFSSSFRKYVSYKSTKLIPHQPVLVKLYCSFLGFTKNNPRYFYAEAY